MPRQGREKSGAHVSVALRIFTIINYCLHFNSMCCGPGFYCPNNYSTCPAGYIHRSDGAVRGQS